MIFTNDWELLAEGSGDFFTLQRDRLRNILNTVEKHGARMTVMAEIGQQLSYLKLAREAATAQIRDAACVVANGWEDCVREVIQRGHDVQLHWHPAWHGATFDGRRWHLDQKVWALIDISGEIAGRTLLEGKRYLNSLGQSVRPDYECVSFRAGAFCLQPESQTIPLIEAAGFQSDSSVLPGYWDYLYFDYREVEVTRRPYSLGAQTKLIEFPVCTLRFKDIPLLRRLLPEHIWQRWVLGVSKDATYLEWARRRDEVLEELAPVLDPLSRSRALARLSPLLWLSYISRTSAYILDYDFLPPEAFASLVEKSVLVSDGSPQSVVALGHANNGHSVENLDRILSALHNRFGKRLSYTTLQDATRSAKGV